MEGWPQRSACGSGANKVAIINGFTSFSSLQCVLLRVKLIMFLMDRSNNTCGHKKIGVILSLIPGHFLACRLKLSMNNLYFDFLPVFLI